MHPDPRNSVSWYLGRRSIYKGGWLMSKDLKRTALVEEHERLGGRLVPFAGDEMPVQDGPGVGTERRAGRDAAGRLAALAEGEGAGGTRRGAGASRGSARPLRGF